MTDYSTGLSGAPGVQNLGSQSQSTDVVHLIFEDLLSCLPLLLLEYLSRASHFNLRPTDGY